MADGDRRPEQRLDVPRGARGLGSFLRLDPDAVGKFAEGIARFLGTGRFLAVQTIMVIAWITFNVVAVRLRWDPYPFILLNLAFSTQAAYAAPLILLAQNRQDERDRVEAERDRLVTARTQADAEFLAREIATVRLALAGMPTADDLSEAVERLTNAMERLAGDGLGGPEPSPTGSAREPAGS